MIATLRGAVIENDSQVVVECGGIGYGVLLSITDASKLAIGKVVFLYIFENIKDDAHDLFGFLTKDNKMLFELLISVKNVGPKSALAVLNIGSADQVRLAIAGGDVKYLQSAKGIGKRAAEQMVVELRDKVGSPVGDAAESLITRGGINQNDEALQALISLGYSEADAMLALQGVDGSLSTEERVKAALKISR